MRPTNSPNLPEVQMDNTEEEETLTNGVVAAEADQETSGPEDQSEPEPMDRRTSCGGQTTADPTEQQKENLVNVDKGNIMPVVSRSLSRFSELQWDLLAAGTPDSATLEAVVDVVTDIIQTYCAETIRALVVTFPELRAAAPAHISLGHSMSASLADALGLPEDRSKDAQQLTELIETEVSQQVNSAINSPALPSQPAIYISGSTSRIGNLSQLVPKMTAYLQRYAMKLRTCCCGRRDEPSEPDEDIESLRSLVSIPAVTESVKEILSKWSSQSPVDWTPGQSLDVPPPTVSSPEAEQVAADIVRMILSDLHYCESGGKSSETSRTPHFNLSPIVTKVTSFLSSEASASTDNNRKDRERWRFFTAAKRQFDKMGADLKNIFKRKHPEFLVDLDQGQSKVRSSEECCSSGRLSESESTGQSRKTQSPVPFDAIKPDVEHLFDMFSQSEEAGKHKTLDNIRLSEKISKFSKELTDKMFTHLMIAHSYQLPVGRRLSDSVLSKVRNEAHQQNPEVLYAMTEDAVGKLVQKLLLLLLSAEEPLDHQTEEVSGALMDIQDLITKTVSSSEEDNVLEPEVPAARDEHSDVGGVCEAPSRDHESYETPVIALRYSESLDSLVSVHEKPEHDERSSHEEPTELVAAPQLVDAPQLVASTEHVRTSHFPIQTYNGYIDVDTSRRLKESMSHKDTNAIKALMLKVMTKSFSKSGTVVLIEDFQEVLDRVLALLDEVYISPNAITQITQKMDKLSKAIVKDLKKIFGSAENLLQAAMSSQDQSFEEAVLMALMVNLKTIPRPDNLKSRVARFFSAVRRAFRKP